MKLFTSLDQFPRNDAPVVATIGNFDGVHLGHQYVLAETKSQAERVNGFSCVITFSNPPSTVIAPHKPLQLILPVEQKVSLLAQWGVDGVMLLPFTKEFSEQSARQFLSRVCDSIPLSHLVLGYDSRIGKDRMGDEAMVRKIGEDLLFAVDYCHEVLINGVSVSSSRIRKAISSGRLKDAEELLGRPLSYLLSSRSGQGLGKKIGFSTLNFDVPDLCLPPTGVYSVWLKTKRGRLPGIANLGYAPTVRNDQDPQLEVHVLDETFECSDPQMEIIFHRWIRDEQKFDNLESLGNQIEKDIITAKQQLRDSENHT